MKKETDTKTNLQQAIMEYKTLYRKKYGITLADVEATKQTMDLINMFMVLRKPIDNQLAKAESLIR